MSEKCFNFRDTHLFGVTLIVNEYVATNPLNIGFFRPVGVVLNADYIADLIEAFLRARLRRLHLVSMYYQTVNQR